VEALVKSIVVLVALLTAFAYLTLVERYVIAKIQSRIGPNRAGRVGPFALLQPIATQSR
jgi:NADH-quinone oxidoreductase subunit H